MRINELDVGSFDLSLLVERYRNGTPSATDSSCPAHGPGHGIQGDVLVIRLAQPEVGQLRQLRSGQQHRVRPGRERLGVLRLRISAQVPQVTAPRLRPLACGLPRRQGAFSFLWYTMQSREISGGSYEEVLRQAHSSYRQMGYPRTQERLGHEFRTRLSRAVRTA